MARELFGLKLGHHSYRERRRARRVAVFSKDNSAKKLPGKYSGCTTTSYARSSRCNLPFFFVSRSRDGPANRAGGGRNVTSSSYFHLFVANVSSPHTKDNVTIFKSQHVVVEAAPRLIFFCFVLPKHWPELKVKQEIHEL